MIGTTDVPAYFVSTSGGKELWQDYEQYIKHSALYKIGNVTTPTQILQGMNDRRVPSSPGHEFYNALKRKGVKTEMIVYPRSGHVPQEPKLLMDISLRVSEWFEPYL
jgi:dipeptidyl aminopeptidase/acylaminoacyl peptidase